MIYPYGQEHGASHVGLNLQCLSDLPLPVQAKYKITVFNHHSDQKTISNGMCAHFFQSADLFFRRHFHILQKLDSVGLARVYGDQITRERSIWLHQGRMDHAHCVCRDARRRTETSTAGPFSHTDVVKRRPALHYLPRQKTDIGSCTWENVLLSRLGCVSSIFS